MLSMILLQGYHLDSGPPKRRHDSVATQYERVQLTPPNVMYYWMENKVRIENDRNGRQMLEKFKG